MRNTLVGAAALAAAVFFSGSAFAGDHGPSLDEREKAQEAQNTSHRTVTFGYATNESTYSRPENFTILYMRDVGDGETYGVNGKATPAQIRALQAEIRANAAVAAELRAHGVQIKNIIGRATALNGRTVYYVQ